MPFLGACPVPPKYPFCIDTYFEQSSYGSYAQSIRSGTRHVDFGIGTLQYGLLTGEIWMKA